MNGLTEAIAVNETVLIGDGGLSVALSRAGDRYRHEVLIASDGQQSAVLASLEGADDQTWPPSPPFQELHLQRRGDEIAAALLVGRAGRGHWSASIEFDRSEETITFDVACRCSGSIDWLGSSYQRVVDVATVGADGHTLLLPPRYQLQVLEGELRASEPVETGLVTISPRWVTSPVSQTVRWKYRFARRLP
jgi:hypothetical protein